MSAEAPKPLIWQDIVDAYQKLIAPYQRQVTVVAEDGWNAMLERYPDQREAFESLIKNGSVIVSPFLPPNVAGYRIQCPS